MWFLWSLITFLVVTFSFVPIVCFISSYFMFPDVIKKTSLKKKRDALISFLFHFIILATWIVLVFSIEIIYNSLIPILVVGSITGIGCLIYIFKNKEIVLKDLVSFIKDEKDQEEEQSDLFNFNMLDYMKKFNLIMQDEDEVEYFSKSEIVTGIINLADAKTKLSPDEYLSVKNVFEELKKDTKQVLINKAKYLSIGMELISNFDLVAPFYKYCGDQFYPSMLAPDQISILEECKIPYREKALVLFGSGELFSIEWENLRREFYNEFYNINIENKETLFDEQVTQTFNNEDKSLNCDNVSLKKDLLDEFQGLLDEFEISDEEDNSLKSLDNKDLEFNYEPDSDSYTLTSIENEKILKIEIPKFYNDGKNGEKPVTGIGQNALRCSSLKSITIPDSLISIGYYDGSYHFECCESLTEINVDPSNPYYSSIDGVLFNKKQTQLIKYPQAKTGNSYIIPSGVTSIGYKAFYYCTNLTLIKIPSSVISIGDSAFYGCSGLTSIEIPSFVMRIGYSAFDSCSNLVEINVDYSNLNYSSIYGVLFNKVQKTLMKYPQAKTGNSYIIPKTVKLIGAEAFRYCPNLTLIKIPRGVSIIEREAFYGCINLTSIKIPKTVKLIGADAFKYCPNLKIIRK